MKKKIIKTTFLVRRGTSEAWNRKNPTLSYGEPGFEKDTNKLKIGDGVRCWRDLPYIEGFFDFSNDDENQIILYGGSATDNI